MVFALLIAAILWNLATWWFGIPSSSSHTLIGSIIGVGVANAHDARARAARRASTGRKATEIGQALLFSPLIGFGLAALLFLAHEGADPQQGALSGAQGRRAAALVDPRPADLHLHRRQSFAHGSNDGQKGMGLIMLILIGTVPTAYALNRAVPAQYVADFRGPLGRGRRASLRANAGGGARPRREARQASHRATSPTRPWRRDTVPALAAWSPTSTGRCRTTARWPRCRRPQRSTTCATTCIWPPRRSKRLGQGRGIARRLPTPEAKAVDLQAPRWTTGTRFIPIWVKVAVAFALGLGTMVGWKRIVVTVGEKIGKTPPDLCAGRLGRAGGHGDDLRGGQLRPAGLDHPRARPPASPARWRPTGRACR